MDALAMVRERSRRSLEGMASAGRLAPEPGLTRQILAVNQRGGEPELPAMDGLPDARSLCPRNGSSPGGGWP